MNHTLMHYGPDANAARNDLKAIVAASVKRDWPGEDLKSTAPAAPQHSNPMEGMHDEVIKLKPVTDVQRVLQAQAEAAGNNLSRGRWLIVEQNKITDLSHPLRGVVQISSGPMLDAFERINRL